MAEERTKSSTGGEKGVKLARFDLVPTGPLTELAEHYGIGASKYANHQWRQGYEWSKSYSALMRHLTAFWSGLDYDVCSNDPDGCSHVDLEGNPFVAVREDACFNHTGSHHLAAVAWHSFLLLEFKDAHQGHDDRYRPTSSADARREISLPKIPLEKFGFGPDVMLCAVDEPEPFVTRVRDGFDMPEPEEPLHGGIGFGQGERAEDLVAAEQGPLSTRWVEDYDAEAAVLRNFPRVKVPGLPTLADSFASEDFGFVDRWFQEALQRRVADDVRRRVMAEARLRKHYGPDLLKKRSPIDWSGRSGG